MSERGVSSVSEKRLSQQMLRNWAIETLVLCTSMVCVLVCYHRPLQNGMCSCNQLHGGHLLGASSTVNAPLNSAAA